MMFSYDRNKFYNKYDKITIITKKYNKNKKKYHSIINRRAITMIIMQMIKELCNNNND